MQKAPVGGAGSVFTSYILRAIARLFSNKAIAIHMISSPHSHQHRVTHTL